MKKNLLLVWILLLSISFVSCQNELRKDRRILKELENGIINTENFSAYFENRETILGSQNSEQLNNTASVIYAHIGIPVSRQDTHRLMIAVEYLDKALDLDSLNRSAYRNKLNILSSMQEWESAIEAIDQWLSFGESGYYDYMLKGFVYEKMKLSDSSRIAFEKALRVFDEAGYSEADDRNQVQKAIAIAFLKGKEAGLAEISRIIEITDSEYALLIKEVMLEDFEKQTYIDEYVFLRPQKLN